MAIPDAAQSARRSSATGESRIGEAGGEERSDEPRIVSVDDHLVEPPDVFAGRVPERFADRAPRIEVADDGTEAWLFDGHRHPQIGLNAVVGRPKEEWSMEPANFADMRRGCWDPEARVADMDTDGVWASVHYPSLIAGFAGTTFARCSDPDLGLACVRAWNDWHIEEWVGPARRPLHPAAGAVAGRPADRGGRGADERGARLPGGELPREPGRHGPAVDAHRPLGSVPRRVRGDGHGGVPALRVVGLVGVAVARARRSSCSPPCSRSTRW